MVAIRSTGPAHVIEDEGVARTQRAIMNFTGVGVTVTDTGGKTVVSVAGSAVAVTPANAIVNIWEGSTDLGYVCFFSGTAATATPALGRLRRTPTAGAKVYTARLWTSAGTATVSAAPTSSPAFLRQVKV